LLAQRFWNATVNRTMKTKTPVSFLVVWMVASIASAHVILNETFPEDQRLVQDLPNTAAWYGTGGSAGSATPLSQPSAGIITLNTSSNAQLLAHFTDFAPVTLDVGEDLRISFDFQMAGAASSGIGIRIGIVDSSGGGGRVTADSSGTAPGSGLFNGYTGYGTFFNPGGGGTTGMQIRERNPTNNALLSSSAVWTTRATGGVDILINDTTTYSGEILISRRTDAVNVRFSLFGENIGAGATVSYNHVGSSLFAFDTFAIWVNAAAGDSFSLTSASIEVPLSVRIERTEGTDLQLTWKAIPGNVYRIQYKMDLTDPEWIDLEPDLVAEGPVLFSTIAADTPRRFLRVRLVTP
jgi:hypothetical protein